MMGTHQPQKDLFNYQVDLDRRIRSEHPLRKIAELVDFSFVRQEVKDTYGYNGNVSVDPAIILKLMFLLFYENVRSERELMQTVPERLDWLWFLGYGLDDEIPDHSVLSKARKRWGPDVFESFFVRIVGHCVQQGLVDGVHGVITAVETTPGDVEENERLMDLVAQHEAHTECRAETVVADRQYGTKENFRKCHERGIRSHMGDFKASLESKGRCKGIFPESAFIYDVATDSYRCPAGEQLHPRKHKKTRGLHEYAAARSICAACALRSQCTRAKNGAPRTLVRHYGQEAIDAARAQSHSDEAYKDRVRRKWLIEGRFGDAATRHGFKRARWRRLWRQQIQDYLIAAIQNVRIALRHGTNRPAGAESCGTNDISGLYHACVAFTKRCLMPIRA